MSYEAVLSSVAERLDDLLIQEPPFRDDMEWIYHELNLLIRFMKDADSRKSEDGRVQSWLAQIRDLCYDLEDVIDTFIPSQRAKKRDGFLGRFESCLCIIGELRTLHEVGAHTQRLKMKINDISSRREIYGISYIDEASSSTATSALLEESKVVGLEDEIKTLSEQLVNGEVRRCVISIVGMGGLGKTALAKAVYRDVKDDFDCHAFICLSQEYVMKDVVMRIIECVMRLSREEKGRLDEVDLKKQLCNYLNGKRYLVVVDDIWSKEAWDDLNLILPDTGQSKSRVILTTRNRDVAVHADSVRHLHEKRLLNDNEGWELFMKKVFPGENPSAACPAVLAETGREIFAKCGGLPLAILVVGGLLGRREATLGAWSKVLKSVTGDLFENFWRILALSYWDLPYYLKPCFLYLGLFPKDSEIRSGRLIRLWIAEGFIAQRGNQIMEDVAEDYLKELVDRSMIQVTGSRSNGSIRTCRIHKVLREFSVSEARQNNFFTIHNKYDTSSSLTSVRRLVLYRFDGYKTTNRFAATLRSIFYFPVSEVSTSSELLNTGCKLLRVLVAEGGEFTKEQVGAFVYLRYLELARIIDGSLPSSIGNHSNLQTLKLSCRGTLPNAIWNLAHLRHLSCSGFNTDEHPKLKKLRNLQTLKLSAGSWIEEGLGKLSNLRKLGIYGDLSSHHKGLSDAIDKLVNLQSLKLLDGHSIPPFESFSRHFGLYKMYLDGKIERLPTLPPNFTELTLQRSLLGQDAISTLGKLPHLKILRLLHESYDGKEMILSQEGFPCLELLTLSELPLEHLDVKEGAMKSLESVECVGMSELKTETLPKGVHSILDVKEGAMKSLESVESVGMSELKNETLPKGVHSILMQI